MAKENRPLVSLESGDKAILDVETCQSLLSIVAELLLDFLSFTWIPRISIFSLVGFQRPSA